MTISSFTDRTECPICLYDNDKENLKTLPCQHEFHEECINKWLNEKPFCPLCKTYSIDKQYLRDIREILLLTSLDTQASEEFLSSLHESVERIKSVSNLLFSCFLK